MHSLTLFVLATFGLAFLFLHSGRAAAEAELDWSVLAYNDGRHNAFTDMTEWRGQYYLGFRNGAVHGDLDRDMGKIFVMRSDDLKKWDFVAVISTDRDDRDAKLVVFNDRLYCFFGSWQTAGGGYVHWVQSHVSWTNDGLHWSDPTPIYKPGFWLWRPRVHEGAFYGVAYTATRPKPDARESRLVTSTNGIHWEEVTTLTRERMMGEADILWPKEGGVWIISRTGDGPSSNAAWFRSEGNLTQWQVDHEVLDGLMHSPAMVQWKDRVFLAGRGGKRNAWDTSVWEITPSGSKHLITLPSSGDTAYPGLLVDPASLETDAPAFFVSWYSQHEKGKEPHDTDHASNIYVGRVVLR